jgi:hypothetical protein
MRSSIYDGFKIGNIIMKRSVQHDQGCKQVLGSDVDSMNHALPDLAGLCAVQGGHPAPLPAAAAAGQQQSHHPSGPGRQILRRFFVCACNPEAAGCCRRILHQARRAVPLRMARSGKIAADFAAIVAPARRESAGGAESCQIGSSM